MSTRFMTATEVAAMDKWYVIDANGQVLGRVATKAATILSGKHRPHYARFLSLAIMWSSLTQTRSG